ncbi:hypothetical protein, partial [Salmonella sp. s54925]|uniref:hypothetical protein n=1 Tax=Salmonella sp. s54925 TaxID=3159674 RepID=UPI0039807B9A
TFPLLTVVIIGGFVLIILAFVSAYCGYRRIHRYDAKPVHGDHDNPYDVEGSIELIEVNLNDPATLPNKFGEGDYA